MADRFERLPLEPIIGGENQPTRQFQFYIQRILEAVETDLTSIESILTDLTAAQADIAAAQADITAAVADIAAAQTDITAAQADITTTQADQADQLKLLKRVTSWPYGVSLGATDAGSDATITVSAHTRIYGNGDTVAILAGSITSLAYSTTYGIYYDDGTLAVTDPAFLATTSTSASLPTANTSRHHIGVITTPAASDPDTVGDPSSPPGGGIDTGYL